MTTRVNGWSSPQIIIAILSLLASAGWAWVGLSREDSSRIDDRLRAVELRAERLSVEIETLRGFQARAFR
jgi:hypothetical protein